MACKACHKVPMKGKPKVLFFDIETTYIIGAVWNVWEVNVAKILQDWRILCVAYKWGDGKIQFVRTNGDDKQLLQKLHELFCDADIIVGHNGNSFDIKKTNARLIYHGFAPPESYKTVDTLRVAKKYFKFTKNDLNSLGEYLGLGKKVKHEGINLWTDCMNNKRSAWKLMRKYNEQDVLLLEKVYKRMLPWMPQPKLKTLKAKRTDS